MSFYPNAHIAVFCRSTKPNRKQLSLSLAKDLGLLLVDDLSLADIFLVVTDSRLELFCPGSRPSNPLFVDFTSSYLTRRRFQGYRSQALSRAVGISHGVKSVFDATAGLGRDAFLLASWGCQVTACERSPILVTMLRDGINRAAQESNELKEIMDRIVLVYGDSYEVLQKNLNEIEVIYIDPMLGNEANKSAQVKKEMQYLRLLLGKDMDAKELALLSLKVAKRRVVIKRPFNVAPLLDNVSATYKSGNMRFDMYCTDL